MTNKDWYEAGDQIRNLVQDAIDKGDFSQLSTTITHVINEAADSVGDALRDSLSGDRRYGKDAAQSGESCRAQTVRERQEAAERIRRTMAEKPQKNPKTDVRQVPAVVKAPGLISGNVMKWTGYSLSGVFGMTTVILAGVGLAAGIEVMMLPAGILGTLFAASTALGIKGSRQVSLANRFRRYKEILGERTFCLIEELASGIGEDSRFVRKDLKKMIRKGFFRQGYLDQKETCLITDQSTYRQYLDTQEAYIAREHQARSGSEADMRNGGLQRETMKVKDEQNRSQPGGEAVSAEYRTLLEEGQSYIRHIHVCNDRIEDEAISEKLNRMETVVARIFAQAARDPQAAGDLKKMMSYYLPTTKKLLDAYCELDGQPVQGQNIETTKKEIEAALDTLNSAFEKLLDGLFEETAWDISSDISVLNTMLAQEGLAGDDFGHSSR